MELSTSLNVYASIGQSYEEKIKRAKKCGFKYFDFNITDYYGYKDSLYTKSNWKDWLKSVKEFADKEDVIFYQSHGLMYEAFKKDRYSLCMDGLHTALFIRDSRHCDSCKYVDNGRMVVLVYTLFIAAHHKKGGRT